MAVVGLHWDPSHEGNSLVWSRLASVLTIAFVSATFLAFAFAFALAFAFAVFPSLLTLFLETLVFCVPFLATVIASLPACLHLLNVPNDGPQQPE